ncbi:MAG: outer membrane beta-barrel protein [Bacteroidales bacterium]
MFQKGFKESDGDYTAKLNVNYLDIPVHAVYGLDLGGNKLQFFVGPYVGVGLTGKAKFEMGDMEEEIDIQFVNDGIDADDDKLPMKRLDVGLDFGAGFMVSTFQIQAQYGLGLANLNPKWDGTDPEDKTSNGVINLSVTYFFGK